MKKRTKVILVVAVVLGILVGGYLWYKDMVRQDENMLNEYTQKQDELVDKMHEFIDLGDYESVSMCLDSIKVLRAQLKENLVINKMTDESEDTFEYLQQRYQLFIEAGKALEEEDSLKCELYLDSIKVLETKFRDVYPE